MATPHVTAGYIAGLLAALTLVFTTDRPAHADQAHGGLMAGSMRATGPNDPHMMLSPRASAKPGDVERARDLASTTGRAIARYKDPTRAVADGYRPFGDVPEAKVVHFVSLSRSIAERRAIDPERPSSLLYWRTESGLKLVGAMFTAPQGASPAALDARVPLSQARWHLHTNICTPRPIWSRAKWKRRLPDGRMMFGAFSPISTRADCKAVGGKFNPKILGWMVHVYPFRANPNMWWHEDHGH